MNGVYISSAIKKRRYISTEFLVAITLITLSLLGPTLSPFFVIAATAGHGLWDVAKHYGADIPFFSWYTWGCAAVDFTYAATLTIYLFTQSAYVRDASNVAQAASNASKSKPSARAGSNTNFSVSNSFKIAPSNTSNRSLGITNAPCRSA